MNLCDVPICYYLAACKPRHARIFNVPCNIAICRNLHTSKQAQWHMLRRPGIIANDNMMNIGAAVISSTFR
ncbi:hypothetical protein ABR36_10840 [Enterobacter ludwigii]|nr:hypothetical protein ABR36_10840 [Enterobacter ludwigii]